MDVFSFIASLVSVITAAVAAYQAWKGRDEARRERKRLDQPITIVLREKGSGRAIKLMSLRRARLTRAELMGRLGMKQRDQQKDYSLEYTSTEPFLEQLERHQEGDGPADFILPATSGEIAQFRVEEERPAPAEAPGAEAAASEMALQSRPGGPSSP